MEKRGMIQKREKKKKQLSADTLPPPLTTVCSQLSLRRWAYSPMSVDVYGNSLLLESAHAHRLACTRTLTHKNHTSGGYLAPPVFRRPGSPSP